MFLPVLKMFSRNLSVPDFVKRFLVSYTQISEAYGVRTSMKFGCDWRKTGHKGRYRKVSERTSDLYKILFIRRTTLSEHHPHFPWYTFSLYIIYIAAYFSVYMNRKRGICMYSHFPAFVGPEPFITFSSACHSA